MHCHRVFRLLACRAGLAKFEIHVVRACIVRRQRTDNYKDALTPSSAAAARCAEEGNLGMLTCGARSNAHRPLCDLKASQIIFRRTYRGSLRRFHKTMGFAARS